MNGNHIQRLKYFGIIATCVTTLSVLSAQTRRNPTVPRNNPSVPSNTNPSNPNADRAIRSAQEAMRTSGVQFHVLKAGTKSEIDDAFRSLAQRQASALFVFADPFIDSQREQVVALAARHALPAVYPWRDYAVADGLMSYGPSLTAVYQQVGGYVGRILKGAKPADLPVLQPTIFELVINLKTAKALGLSVPPTLVGRANELIE